MSEDLNGFRINLTDKEKKLISIIRNSEDTELKIIIQEKQPIRVEELKNSINL